MLVAAAALAVTAPGAFAWAAEKSEVTTIEIPDLDCASCAKNLAESLKKVDGVADAKADPKKKVATVVPKPKKTASPRALWEAIEEGGKTPAKLTGPSGTFTEKPKK
jgi:copper chaperone CopZ